MQVVMGQGEAARRIMRTLHKPIFGHQLHRSGILTKSQPGSGESRRRATHKAYCGQGTSIEKKPLHLTVAGA